MCVRENEKMKKMDTTLLFVDGASEKTQKFLIMDFEYPLVSLQTFCYMLLI